MALDLKKKKKDLLRLQQQLSLLLFKGKKCRRLEGKVVETSSHITVDPKLQSDPP